MYDYHTHSDFSEDSSTPLEEMIRRAISLGVREYAVTDHYDPDMPGYDDWDAVVPQYYTELLRLESKYKPEIKLIKGIEIGIQHGETMQKCQREAEAFPYDFIIGSFHCAEGMDVTDEGYFAGRVPEDVYRAFYSYMLENLKIFKNYDVIGHFNVIDRYTPRIPAPDVYMDLVEDITDLLISDGKGIEINTSSFRYGMGDRTTPAAEILRLYADRGGEIITTGSDAHSPEHIGFMLDYAEEMIRTAGIKYLSTFENRKLAHVKI
jgi:histidinol-phosphatase (PHP family)